MTLRITRIDDENGTLLRIDGNGRLSSTELAALRRSCEEAGVPLTIDLSGLSLADDATVEAFRDLAADGARLVGASSYIALRLER